MSCPISNRTKPDHLGAAAFFTCLGEVEKVKKGHPVRNLQAN